MRVVILLFAMAAMCLMFVGCAPLPEKEGPQSAKESKNREAAKTPLSPAIEKVQQPIAAEIPEKKDIPAMQPNPAKQEKPAAKKATVPVEQKAADERKASFKMAGLDPKEREALASGMENLDSLAKVKFAFGEVKLGDEAAGKKNIDSAIRHYEAALVAAPEAPKHRFAYAQLLYWKGLSYAQEGQATLDKSLNVLPAMGEWFNTPAKLSDKEKKELEKKSEECRRRGKLYFEKALKELMRCDVDWNYVVEAVPYAKGIVLIMMDRLDEAKSEFKRILDSKRIKDEMKRKIKGVIELIDKNLKERKEKDTGSGKKESE